MSQIKWTLAGGGDFATAADWSTGVVPGASDDAILQALSTAYTVTTSGSPTVNSIQIAQHNTLSITGGTFTATNGTGSGVNNGLILINDNTNFEAGGTISGTGTILISGTGNDYTNFILGNSTTLQGGGVISLEVNNSTNRIYGASGNGTEVLSNLSDTIAGAGQIGVGQMILKNGAAGVINATSSNTQLLVNVDAGSTNAGLMEATGTGGLRIQNSTITQSGTGTLKAVGTGVAVNLDSAVIVGGTLTTSGGGVIESVNSGELNGVTINTGSQVYALDNTALLLDGTITNKGTITINGVNNDYTNLIINSGTVTLTGAGVVNLEGGNNTNRIYSASGATYQLVNVNNTIQGSGQIGIGQLGLDNRALGVIDATGSAGLTIVLNSFSNEGLVESTTTSLAIRSGTVVTNTGTIGAFGNGAAVTLYDGSAITGGILATSGTGVIQTGNSGELNGSTKGNPITITKNSNVLVNDNTTLLLDGTINNVGTITINGVGNDDTNLVANTATVTLTGGGVVQMEPNNSTNRIYGSTTSNVLVNVNNLIEGAGQLGAGGNGSFDNQAAGVINANAPSVGITINAVTFTNEGLIESTATSGLTIQSNITNTGTIGAFGTLASYVLLNNGASIVGGTLATSATGTIYVQNGEFDGNSAGAITIASGSNVVVDDNTSLNLDGTIKNFGTITINGNGNDNTNLIANTPTVTLTGGGVVQMEPNNSTNRIYGNTLVNANNLIEGAGQLGAGGIGSFDNQAAGVINANAPGIGITINAVTFTNEGLIESTATSGLTIQSNITNTGTIGAFGTLASNVLLDNSAIVVGGTLATSATGTIYVANGEFDGNSAGAITLASGSNVVVDDNTSLNLDGTIKNFGTITINGNGNDNTNLIANTPTVTLTGGGVVQMEPNNSTNRIYGNTLVNANNLIEGAGQLGAGGIGSFDNQAAGVINANAPGIGITINAVTFTNEGLIESTATSGLTIQSNITNTGTIGAFGTLASYVLLDNGASIVGGTLATSATGTIYVQNGEFDGTASGNPLKIATGSNVVVSDNTTLNVAGTISNAGTITINGNGGDNTNLIVLSNTTLTGGGLVQLEPNSSTNRIYGNSSSVKLVNVNNTIQGAGQIGVGQLTLDNQAAGVIDANTAIGLDISLGSTFTNEGLAEASAGGGLTIENATLTNTGTIAALSDSAVNIASTTTLTNLNAGGTLTGGTYESISAGGTHTSSLAFNDGSITTDNATLILSGVGASITTNGTALANSLVTVGASGTLEVLNGASFASAGTLTDNNTILLSGSLSGTGLTIGANGTLTGTTGTSTIKEAGKIVVSGLLQAANGGTLTVSQGTLTSGGTLQALAGSTLAIATPTKFASLAAGTLSGGTYAAIGAGATLALGTGTITTDAATVTLSGAGSVISQAGGTLLEATLTAITAAGQLDVLGGRGFASTAAGGLTDNGLIALAGGTLSAASLTIGSSGSLNGIGVISTAITDNGSVSSTTSTLVPAGTLTLTQLVSGTGSLGVGSGNTVIANAGYSVGSVTVAGGGTLVNAGTASGAIVVNGTLQLNGGTLSGGSIGINSAAGLLIGNGTVAQSVSNSGTIDASGGTLALAAGESGGTLIVAASAALISNAAVSASNLSIGTGGVFSGFGSVAQKVISSGTLDAAGGTLTLGAGETGGTVKTETGSTLVSTAAGIAAKNLTVGVRSSFVGFGTVSGATSDKGTIDVSGGTLTLTGAEMNGTLMVENASALIASTAGIAAKSVSIASGGTFSGFGSVSAGFSDTGVVIAAGGSLTLNTLFGTGSATIATGASLSVAGQVSIGGGVTFAAGGNETLLLGQASGNNSVVSGFGSGDTIDVTSQALTSVSYNSANGKLNLMAGTSFVGSITLAGSYSKTSFMLTGDGHGGTDIVYVPGMIPAGRMNDLHAAASVAAAGTAPARPDPHAGAGAAGGGSLKLGAAMPEFAHISHVMELPHHA